MHTGDRPYPDRWAGQRLVSIPADNHACFAMVCNTNLARGGRTRKSGADQRQQKSECMRVVKELQRRSKRIHQQAGRSSNMGKWVRDCCGQGDWEDQEHGCAVMDRVY